LTSARSRIKLTVQNKNLEYGGSGEPLRELGWQAAVTIVSEEPYAPSQRPPLFQAFLSGNAQPTTLKFRSAEH
jgi:hypothetical protein